MIIIFIWASQSVQVTSGYREWACVIWIQRGFPVTSCHSFVRAYFYSFVFWLVVYWIFPSSSHFLKIESGQKSSNMQKKSVPELIKIKIRLSGRSNPELWLLLSPSMDLENSLTVDPYLFITHKQNYMIPQTLSTNSTTYETWYMAQNKMNTTVWWWKDVPVTKFYGDNLCVCVLCCI